jgi:hypothetical protein
MAGRLLASLASISREMMAAKVLLNGNLEWPMVGLENRPKKGFREELKAN